MLLLLSPQSCEFALDHTSGGSLSSPLLLMALLLCLEVQGPEQEGKEELRTRKLCPEATCNNGPLKNYRFFDPYSTTNPIIFLSA